MEEKANAGVRFVSSIIDSFILMIIGSIFAFIPYAGSVLPAILSILYFTYFFGNGQTFGMKAMKIKLIGTKGEYPIGYKKGFIRWAGMLVSGAVIGLGYIWILIDKDKQGWHDKIADTYVVEFKE